MKPRWLRRTLPIATLVWALQAPMHLLAQDTGEPDPQSDVVVPEIVLPETGAESVAAEELDDPEMALLPAGEPQPVDARTSRQLADAETLFASADPAGAVPVLDALIADLEPQASGGHPDDEAKTVLARALGLRAHANAMVGAADQDIDRDLGRALAIRPGFDFDRAAAPDRLLARFDRLRDETIGTLELVLVDPPDLELRVDGAVIERPIDAEAPGSLEARTLEDTGLEVPVLAGSRRLLARRVGFAPQVIEVEVEAGASLPVEIQLDRVAPVLRLNTRPSGAEVIIDGVSRGTTSGVARPDFLPAGAAARFLREEFSSAFEIADLAIGQHQLEVRHPGYRTYQISLSILEAIDYEVPPVVLDRVRGTVIVRGVPASATVQVDGEAVPGERRGDRVRLDVAPGEHRLLIEEGPAKMFARSVRIADRQTIEIDADLKPGLALLGVRGGDREAASRLERRLRELLDDGRFTAIEQIDEALLDRLDLTAESLRDPKAAIDWRAAQREIAGAHTGMVYVLGVLADDLLATRAELLVWAPPAAPPNPDRLEVALDDEGGLDRLASALGRSVAIERTWLGALIIDGAEGQSVVAQVTPGSPAAEAGLAVGDIVSQAGGAPVSRASEIRDLVDAAEIGEPVTFAVDGRDGPRQARVVLGASPQVLRDQVGWLGAAIFADLALLEARVDPADRWLVQLNRAKALIDAREWVDAARELRNIRAPAEARWVGAGTVDYWLGIALLGAGPSYVESARSAFERASAALDARLFHNDGPWVAPRARARLAALAADSTP